MRNIKVGGVPEHFNYPWLKCLEEESFLEKRINLSWKDCHGGTGEMISELRKGNIDLAIMLTEGCVREIELGTPFTILQQFIETPLTWGVFVHEESQIFHLEDLKGKTAAISRINSGSHLMTYVLAEKFEWNIDSIQINECFNLEGAFNSLKEFTSDYLLWEKFTTKPHMQAHNLRHIGDCPTPWPCFVIVSRTDFKESNSELITDVLKIINTKTKSIKDNLKLNQELASFYNMRLQDANEWLAITRWSQQAFNQAIYDSILAKMKSYSIIS
jgi:ABC-type nitrate/sulfonate/bicarbonate transport system substrate-binding protein